MIEVYKRSKLLFKPVFFCLKDICVTMFTDRKTVMFIENEMKD